MIDLSLDLNIDQIMLISFLGLLLIGAFSTYSLNKIYKESR